MMTWSSGARGLSATAAVVLLVGGLLGGCGKPGADGAGGGGGEGGGFTFPPTAVEAAPVRMGPVSNVFETIGTLEAGETVTIVSEIDGIAVQFPFGEGDAIAKGAPIARIDATELAAELARAEALRDQRAASHRRVSQVVEQGAAAHQDLDDATAALRVAEADVALASARYRKTRISAPFAGVMGRCEVSPGAYLRAGEPIAELVQLSELEVVFSVPERYAGELTRGTEVTVSTIAFPGERVTGRIDVIDPNLDPVTRSVRVVARIANPDHRYRPGMSANVRAVLSARESALAIPGEAVFAEGDQFFAYVIQPDSTVARVALELGTRLARSVEILDGLHEGDLVVRAGHQKLFPGAKVFAVNSAALGGDEADAPDTLPAGAGSIGDAGDSTAASEAARHVAAEDDDSAVPAATGDPTP